MVLFSALAPIERGFLLTLWQGGVSVDANKHKRWPTGDPSQYSFHAVFFGPSSARVLAAWLAY